ncbi:MAG: cobalamin biosynthesis protein [Dehalococcoidales bacterium]|nr:cobalamin biosynthesis protein [Dehalococcoidales bacterium]
MNIPIILFLALAIDLAAGEPAARIHPVVWMGKLIGLLEKGAHGKSHAFQFIYGMLIVLVTMVIFAGAAYFVLSYLKGISLAAYIVLGALLLKSTFSLRGLRQVALKIKRLLIADKLDEARFELRALVGRNTKDLPKPLLVSATVESVAESTCDGLIAPLFYFLLLGVPGAIAYRVANTADSMVGYRGQYEYLGKFAARLDDVLNFVPARLSALLLVLVSFLSRQDGRASWQVAMSDHTKTASPNGGWPMAAVAGALNVQLEKVGYHKLGRANTPLVPETIDASLSLMQLAVFAWAMVCLGVGVIHAVAT